MEVRIQAIHFEISERLESFITKKIDKLVRRNENVTGGLLPAALIIPAKTPCLITFLPEDNTRLTHPVYNTY